MVSKVAPKKAPVKKAPAKSHTPLEPKGKGQVRIHPKKEVNKGVIGRPRLPPKPKKVDPKRPGPSNAERKDLTKRKTPYVRKPKIAPVVTIEEVPPAAKIGIVKFAPPPVLDVEGKPLPSFLQRPNIPIEDAPPRKKLSSGKWSKFSRDIFIEICDRIVEGEALTTICKSDPEYYPTPGGFLYWVNTSEELGKLDRQTLPPDLVERLGLAALYAQAAQARKDVWAEQYLEVSASVREGSKTTITESQKDGKSVKVETYDMTERTKQHASALQWLLSKLDVKYAPPRQHVDLNPNEVKIEGGLPAENVPEEDIAEDIVQTDFEGLEKEMEEVRREEQEMIRQQSQGPGGDANN